MARTAPESFPHPAADLQQTGIQTAVLAGGCFWCTEAVFERLPGVSDVTSGYAGGTAETANYQAVCSGRTRHAEAIRITYNASQTSYGELLRIFFAVAHDPTQLDCQGNDRGPQYRSAIFYADDEQKRVAEAYIAQIDAAAVYGDPIVTTLEPLGEFYEAEDYHQDYARGNPTQPYVCAVALPKVAKLDKMLATKV